MRNTREFTTLAHVLDCIMQGRLPQAVDLLCQRWKALETAVSQGGWAQAQWLELIPSEDVTIVSELEARMLAKRTLLQSRLVEAKKKAQSTAE